MLKKKSDVVAAYGLSTNKPFSVRAKKVIAENWELWLLILLPMVHLFIFAYIPMYGIQIAFKDFKPLKGYAGSPWVGFKHFQRFLSSYLFGRVVTNTVLINVYGLIFGFPLPIILALMLNEVRSQKWKKFVQNITYAPYFISTVVLVGMLNLFFATNGGMVNMLLAKIGVTGPNWLENPKLFKLMYVGSGIWQGTGWGAILFIATLAGVDREVLEAAAVDGASRWQRVIHINIPHLVPTIILVLIMSFGGMLSVGHEKVLLMMNSLNMEGADVISTYIYRKGLVNYEYSMSTAVGLFNTVINFGLLLIVNTISRSVSEYSLF